MNRLLHGCRSKKAVLPDEDPAEYQATVQDWFDQYQPSEHDETVLVEQTALAHWHFLRASKHLQEIEFRLPGDAYHWTDEHQRLFSNFSRYKTTAERSLIRWYKELEAYQGREWQFEQAQEHLRIKTASVELAWLKKNENTALKEAKVTQIVRVEQQENGSATTACYPTNQQIIEDIASRSTKPLLLQRYIEFPRGVPPEYDWAHPNDIQRIASCSAVQRFFYPDWLQMIEHEKSSPHIGAMNSHRPLSTPLKQT